MKAPPFFRIYPADMMTDLRFMRLALEERGAVDLLLMHQWLNGTIPTATKDLMFILRSDEATVGRLLPTIKNVFSRNCGNGEIANRWLQDEREALIAQRGRMSRAGKIGNENRWRSQGHVTSQPPGKKADQTQTVCPRASTSGSDRDPIATAAIATDTYTKTETKTTPTSLAKELNTLSSPPSALTTVSPSEPTKPKKRAPKPAPYSQELESLWHIHPYGSKLEAAQELAKLRKQESAPAPDELAKKLTSAKDYETRNPDDYGHKLKHLCRWLKYHGWETPLPSPTQKSTVQNVSDPNFKGFPWQRKPAPKNVQPHNPTPTTPPDAQNATKIERKVPGAGEYLPPPPLLPNTACTAHSSKKEGQSDAHLYPQKKIL